MKTGNKVTAYRYNKNDELLRTDTLNTSTEEDTVVIYKNDKNGNQLATVNRHDIPDDRKDGAYIDINVTLGDNRLNDNVVNHYNALNQLTQTLTGNYKVSFDYDADGLRTGKTVNGEKTVCVWDGDQLVMELASDGKVKHRYIRGNDLVYSDSGKGTGKQYYVTDPHGNVVQLTDEKGNITRTYEYDSFGNEINPDKKDDNPFRYCCEYYNKETDTIYLRARYYQQQNGRFLTRDTYTGEDDDPLSLHLYTYCGNDGVNRVDPSGNIFDTILDIASIGYSLYILVTEPSWENAAFLAWDIGATVVPGVPGSYIEKAGKAVSSIARSSKAVQKGAKYARKISSGAGKIISKGRGITKGLLKRSSKALKKRVDLYGRKLFPRTKKALNKAKKTRLIREKGTKGPVSYNLQFFAKEKYKKSNYFERFFKKKVNTKELHINPLDDFANPKIGPSDRMVSKYIREILNTGKISEPIMVQKLSSGGYEIINGHHRWYAAKKVGLKKVPIKICK